jgi:hypothetical protein
MGSTDRHICGIERKFLRATAIHMNLMWHGIEPLRVVTSRNNNDNRNARRPMPFLLWMPMIIMSGMWEIAEENTRAILRAGLLPDE